MFQDATINGVTLLLLVGGLVEFAKKFGLKGNSCVLASLVLGVSVGILYQALPLLPPQAQQWVGIVVWGVAFGLAASGLYDIAKAFRQTDS